MSLLSILSALPRRLLRLPLRLRLAAMACAAIAAVAGREWLACSSPPATLDAPPFSLHVRSPSESVPSPAADLDIVYVSGFPANFAASVRSLCAFVRPARLGAVHVIVPDAMEAHFSAVAVRLSRRGGCAALPFRVWPESAVVPAFTARARHGGTVRQMALKLAAAFIVNAPFYLVMDSDVFARRPFGVEDLLTGGGGGGGAPLRARPGLDDDDPAFAQPASWFRESAALLGTSLIEDTAAYCAHRAGGGGATWFAASGGAQLPAAPFALLPAGDAGGTVYGACRADRGLVTHVTPMVLARALVRDVLAPRLARRGGKPWLDTLLAYQSARESACWQDVPLLRLRRFYTWTEYSLYFIAAVAAGALDQYHDFSAGGVTSLAHSVMTPERYDAADWRDVFATDADTAPFFIVHSWLSTRGKSLADLVQTLDEFVPGLADRDDADAGGAAPTPLPPYR